MGVFKVNGTDITTIAEVINNTDTRGKSVAFSSGKLNVTGLADSNKTLANAPESDYPNWGLHNIVGNKLKVNGVADTVAKKGTRPNIASLSELASISGAPRSETISYNPDTDTLTIGNSTYIGKSVIYFELVGGGGGAGGGNVNFWGGATAGGGGGGGGYVNGIIDMAKVPNNLLTVTAVRNMQSGTDYSGLGGSGKNNGYDGMGYAITDGSDNIIAYGGKGGSAGNSSNNIAASGGAGGSYYLGTIPGIYIKQYYSGEAGGKSGSNGNSSSNKQLSIPMDNSTLIIKGKTGGSSGGGTVQCGGGGGASSATIKTTCMPGAGGADRANGSSGSYVGAGGGGGGANASGNGQRGGNGSTGGCFLYY